jgi:hypothetical protein
MGRGRTTLAFALGVVASLSADLVAGTARADEAPPPPPPPSTVGTPVGDVASTPVVKPSVVVWPTLTPAGDSPGTVPLHKPVLADGHVVERAQELDATLRDAVEDLGYTLYVADTGPVTGRTRDEDLIERAARSAMGQRTDEAHPGTWVVSPRIESAGGGDFVVRIVTVAPSSHELHVRVETVPGDRVAVRGLVMLRDLLTSQAAASAASEAARDKGGEGKVASGPTPSRSAGRAILATGGGLLGAFTAYSLQQASGSTDPRVLYPLLAVGTGIGIGAALLAADEWDVTTGDAWYLTGGAFWGATSGLLIAAGGNVQPTQDRYTWGVGGGLIGLSLATLAVTQSTMDDGDATLVHSPRGRRLSTSRRGRPRARRTTAWGSAPRSGSSAQV